MFGTGIKTVEGRLFVSQRQPPICTYLCTYNFLEACSSRNHVSHSWRSNASIGFSCGKPIYMYYAAPFYRSASNQESSPFLCSPLVLLLLHLASRQLSVSFFFFIRLFIQAFSLCLIFFFFYHLSTFSSFSFLSNYLSLLDRRSIFISPFIFSCTFPAFSSSHPFLQSLYPSFCSPILLFSSASDLYPSFVSRRLSSTLSFFPRFQERGGFSFTFRHLKNFFRFHFLVCISSIFFSNHFLFPFFPYLFILFCSRMFLCLFILFFPVYSIVKIPFII